MEPKVWNKRDCNVPNDAVYVGRPTKWGNPFSHRGGTLACWVVGSREEAVVKYEEWLLNSPKLLECLEELRGKHLVCWCKPESCHADILLKLANEKLIKGVKDE